MLGPDSLDFSFSGLKTHALQAVRASDGSQQAFADIARAFEAAIVDTLVVKSQRALEQTGFDTLVIAGGVGANRRLREELRARLPAQVIYPRIELCTDNGAMIAYAGYLRYVAGQRDSLAIEARPRWPLSTDLLGA